MNRYRNSMLEDVREAQMNEGKWNIAMGVGLFVVLALLIFGEALENKYGVKHTRGNKIALIVEAMCR